MVHIFSCYMAYVYTREILRNSHFLDFLSVFEVCIIYRERVFLVWCIYLCAYAMINGQTSECAHSQDVMQKTTLFLVIYVHSYTNTHTHIH